MPLGECHRRGKHHQIVAPEHLGGDTTWKVADHSGFRHEARNKIYIRNSHRYASTEPELRQRFIHDAAIVSRQCRQDMRRRHVGFEIDGLTYGRARMIAFDNADVGIGKKSFAPDALRHLGKRGEDQVDIAAVKPVKETISDPKEIEGKQALFIVNLAPRTMAGETSEGMMFDIGYADGLPPVLAVPERPIPNGARAG